MRTTVASDSTDSMRSGHPGVAPPAVHSGNDDQVSVLHAARSAPDRLKLPAREGHRRAHLLRQSRPGQLTDLGPRPR